jgi:acetyltransferase-like isoleucine patch superfamily enzyme
MSFAEKIRRGRRGFASRLVHRGWAWVREAGAVSAERPGPLRFAELGPFTKLAFPQGTIFNEHAIAIGCYSIIGERVSLSAGFAPGLKLSGEPIVRIGDGCVIGRDTNIVGHESIVIEDNVWTGPSVYISDQNHSYDDPQVPIGKQWPRNEPVRIGAGSWIGTGAVVLPGADIGRNVVVAANAVVRGHVPDNTVVAGAPAKPVRRWTEDEGWQPPIRTAPPRAIPDGVTHEELLALIGWDLHLPPELQPQPRQASDQDPDPVP